MLNLLKDSLHHAYVLEGKRELLLPQLLEFVEKELGVVLRGNPDLYQIETDTMGIDEARALKERAGLRSSLGGKKIFIISVRDVTDQAQNALLKLFEEPTPETHFFLIIPNALNLLPTLRSRMILITSDKDEERVDVKVKTFIKAIPSKRLDIINDLLKESSKEEEKGVSRGRALEFLSGLEIEMHRNVLIDKLTTDERLFFSELIQARQFLADQGSSPKILLEYITLLLPRY